MDELLNILLVSPNKTKFTDLFRSNCFKIKQAHGNTEIAYYLNQTDAFDVAVIDLTENISNGLDAVERISLRSAGGPILVIVGLGDINTLVQAMRRGAYDYLIESFNTQTITQDIERTAQIDLRSSLMRARQHLWSRESGLSGVWGSSNLVSTCLHRCAKLARTESSVLIFGPNGVGKNHLARTAHFLSKRRFQPLITVDCSSESEYDLSIQLFGEDESGSQWKFPIAKGAIEDAVGGTLLLDEVAEIPLQIQKRLVNALTRANKDVPSSGTNIRLLSTTRYNPERLKTDKLDAAFYQLVCDNSIAIPALSERTEDIEDLAAFFLEQFARQCRKRTRKLSAEALNLLQAHSWPENVRELRNLLERVVVLSNEEYVQAEELSGLQSQDKGRDAVVELKLKSRKMNGAEEALIAEVLNETKGNVSKSANLLGISRGTLYSKIRKYGLQTYTKRAVLAT